MVGWLVGCFVYSLSTFIGSSNIELSHFGESFNQFSLIQAQILVSKQLNVKTVPFQTIQFSISTQFKHTVEYKTVLFQTIQFSKITQFSSI